jgi:hypothetical protein
MALGEQTFFLGIPWGPDGRLEQVDGLPSELAHALSLTPFGVYVPHPYQATLRRGLLRPGLRCPSEFMDDA